MLRVAEVPAHDSGFSVTLAADTDSSGVERAGHSPCNLPTHMMMQPYTAVQAYRTKDGSEIRELMHPDVHGNRAQSLAEASVPVGTRTFLHRHHLTEEIYHVTAGTGLMTLGTETFPVGSGDTICIPPGTPHRIEAIGPEVLRLLCCCSPAYSHADTELLGLSPESESAPGA